MGERSGEPWSAAEYAQLAGELGGGQDAETIAIAHARTPSAIRAAAARMIPIEEKVRSRDAPRWLAERLPDGYDWEGVLRARLLDEGIRYWSAEEDTALAEAWAARRALPELARRFQCDELAVVRHLTRLGLAESLVAVVKQLGAEPGGIVELRYRLATDAQGVQLHVLVAQQGDGELHVSVHPSPEAAEEARARVQPAPGADLPWLVAARAPGALDGPLRSNSRSGTAPVLIAPPSEHGPQAE
ncbi:hypothetical protein HEK616_84090 (plasmid) [Streptomyces nigrescens]|uniref:Uncharacterized protein n=1 Tax=Streptomyces nigrescens TaxID=1920 RepID=A0ABN6RAW4_STRNI|nr:hypothetical protein [Streptomyces nigrescens]BDM74922.1 hypothetical protein HEK616_84090 [Streptomyces nigrescens]